MHSIVFLELQITASEKTGNIGLIQLKEGERERDSSFLYLNRKIVL